MIKYIVSILILLIVLVNYITEIISEHQLVYYTKELSMYTEFPPSVISANFDTDQNVMTIFISQAKDSINYVSTSNPSFQAQVCSFSVRYRLDVDIKEVVIYNTTTDTNTEHQCSVVDAISSATAKK